jgi:membrane-associated phospholipid phosphatase
MYNTKNPEGIQPPTAATTLSGKKRENTLKRYRVVAIVWGIGLLLFIVSCFIIHAHPQPFPIDIATTQLLQNLQDVRWADTILHFVGAANEPATAPIAVTICFVPLLLVGWISQRRGESSMRLFVSAILLAVAAAGTFALNQVIDQLVNRPRPSSTTSPIRHHTQLVPVPSYPSGHVEYVTIFYGFLLFLSFTRPVREWRYRWLLIPLQLYSVFILLTIGISRITELDHWLTDVLGAYFEGALYLVAFIFLYWWTLDWLTKRRAKRLLEKSTKQKAP